MDGIAPSLIFEFIFAYMNVGKGREHDPRDGGGRVALGAATEDAEALPSDVHDVLVSWRTGMPGNDLVLTELLVT